MGYIKVERSCGLDEVNVGAGVKSGSKLRCDLKFRTYVLSYFIVRSRMARIAYEGPSVKV